MNTFRHHILRTFLTGLLVIVLLNFSINITLVAEGSRYAEAEEIETIIELIIDDALDLTEIAPCTDEPDAEQIPSLQKGIIFSGSPGFLTLPDYTPHCKKHFWMTVADVVPPVYEQPCPPPEVM